MTVDGRDFKLQIQEGNNTVTKSLHFLTDQVFGNFSDVPNLPFVSAHEVIHK